MKMKGVKLEIDVVTAARTAETHAAAGCCNGLRHDKAGRGWRWSSRRSNNFERQRERRESHVGGQC